MISRLNAWATVTYPVSLFLICGWVIFGVSLLLGKEIPASGGAMVAAAILSELYLSHDWAYGTFAGAVSDINRSGAATTGEPFAMPEGQVATRATGNSYRVHNKLLRFDYLQVVRIDSDIVGGIWLTAKTINRIKRGLVWRIAATAIVGTIVWAYGHCLVEIF